MPARWRTPAVVIVAGCLIGLVSFGLRSSFGLFTEPLGAVRGFDRETFAFAIAVQNLMWGLGQPFAGRAALLSPFDRLVHDRKRMVELFGFDYQLEMYKPAAKRRWGYFALPILSGDSLVGKLDATADRKGGVLRVDAIHRDVPFDAALTGAVHDEIADLARWLALDLVLPG